MAVVKAEDAHGEEVCDFAESFGGGKLVGREFGSHGHLGWVSVGDRRFAVGAVEGYRAYGEIADGQSTERPAERTAGTTMLYTSGTTGRPKGVRRPLPGIDPNDAGAASSLLSMLFDIIPGPGAHLVAGPLYHAAPLRFTMSVIGLGGTVVVMEHFDAEQYLALIERYHVTHSQVVPTMFVRLLKLDAAVRRAQRVGGLRCLARRRQAEQQDERCGACHVL